MRFTPSAILIIVAVVLFLATALLKTSFDTLALGLAAFAAAFLFRK